MEHQNEDLIKMIAIYKQNLTDANDKIVRLQVHCSNLMKQIEELKEELKNNK